MEGVLCPTVTKTGTLEKAEVCGVPKCLIRLVRPAGIEPATTSLEGWCSIQLSYGRVADVNTLRCYPPLLIEVAA